MSTKRTIEQVQRWWNRIQYETPPWAWKQDPYLAGITESEFKWLRDLACMPTKDDLRAREGR